MIQIKFGRLGLISSAETGSTVIVAMQKNARRKTAAKDTAIEQKW
jgi:hypothetical protein